MGFKLFQSLRISTGSRAAEMADKFYSDTITKTSNLAASRILEICR